jgi:hypothetical protein
VTMTLTMTLNAIFAGLAFAFLSAIVMGAF